MEKDRKIVIEWLAEAEKRARKQGFKRMYRADKMIDLWMRDEHAFSTTPEEKEQVIGFMVRLFMDFEKICQLIRQDGVMEYSVKTVGEIIQW